MCPAKYLNCIIALSYNSIYLEPSKKTQHKLHFNDYMRAIYFNMIWGGGIALGHVSKDMRLIRELHGRLF